MFYTFQKNNTDICMMTDVLDRLLSDLNQINYEWVKANADPLAMSLGIEAKLIVARSGQSLVTLLYIFKWSIQELVVFYIELMNFIAHTPL